MYYLILMISSTQCLHPLCAWVTNPSLKTVIFSLPQSAQTALRHLLHWCSDLPNLNYLLQIMHFFSTSRWILGWFLEKYWNIYPPFWYYNWTILLRNYLDYIKIRTQSYKSLSLGSASSLAVDAEASSPSSRMKALSWTSISSGSRSPQYIENCLA